MTGGWRKLYNEELHNLYPSRTIITMIKLEVRLAGHIARMKRYAYKLVVGKAYRKRQFREILWPLFRKRHTPTERQKFVGEIMWQPLRIEGCHVVSAADPPRSLISVF
jgi:hypothetical protein